MDENDAWKIGMQYEVARLFLLQIGSQVLQPDAIESLRSLERLGNVEMCHLSPWNRS